MAKSAWGIELGSSRVKAVKLSNERGNVILEQISIISLKDYGLGSGTSHEDATAGALNDLRVSNGIKKGDEIFVSIAAQNTLGRIISLPPVAPDRVRETIQNEARSQIPIKLEEAVWDYQVIEGSSDDDELQVNLYAAKREVVEELFDICDSAGLEISGIQVAALGMYNYIKYELDDSISDTCGAIDIGADNTDVVIIAGQKTYVRVVPVAGNDITKALRARFKLSMKDAEKLKRRAAKSKDAAAVFEAMKPPLKEMVGEIYRAVGFYKSQHADANINQLVMMGNGSKLLNIKKFFEQQLQFATHKVETPTRIGLSRSIDPSEVQESIQSLTVAIGLGLQGLGVGGASDINLVPRERIDQKEKAKLRVPFIAAGVLAMIGGIAALALSFYEVGQTAEIKREARTTSAAKKQRDKEFAQHVNIGGGEMKARSLENLFLGKLGTLTWQGKDENDKKVVLTRDLKIPASMLPGLIVECMEETISEYANSNPRFPIFRANHIMNARVGAPLDESGSSPAAWFQVEQQPAWESVGKEGEGHWITTRTYSYTAEIASELRGGDVVEAHSALEQAVSGGENKFDRGLLTVKLRDRIKAYLESSGQFDGVSAAVVDGAAWDKMIVVRVLKDFKTLDVIRVAGIVVAADLHDGKRYIRAKFKDKRQGPQFSLSFIQVNITLGPIAAPKEVEEE